MSRAGVCAEAPALEDADISRAIQEASVLLGGEQAEENKSHALSSLLYPEVFRQYAKARNHYGDLSTLPTLSYFYGLEEGEEIEVELEPGKRIIIRLTAIGETNELGERTVFFELNGQQRNFTVIDKSLGGSVLEKKKSRLE